MSDLNGLGHAPQGALLLQIPGGHRIAHHGHQAAGLHRRPAHHLGAVGDGAGEGALHVPAQLLPAAYTGHGRDIIPVPVEVQAAHDAGGMGAAVAGGVQQGDAHDRRLQPPVEGGAAAVFIGHDPAGGDPRLLDEQLHAAHHVRRGHIPLLGRRRSHHGGGDDYGVRVNLVQRRQVQVAELYR